MKEQYNLSFEREGGDRLYKDLQILLRELCFVLVLNSIGNRRMMLSKRHDLMHIFTNLLLLNMGDGLERSENEMEAGRDANLSSISHSGQIVQPVLG